MSFTKRFQNEEGDWYWIPAKMEQEFLGHFAQIEGKDYDECPDTFDSFDEKYSRFATGGDINNVPEYFQDPAKAIVHPEEAKNIRRFLDDFDNLMNTGHFKDEDVSDFLYLKEIKTMERFAAQAREYTRQLLMIREEKASLS